MAYIQAVRDHLTQALAEAEGILALEGLRSCHPALEDVFGRLTATEIDFAGAADAIQRKSATHDPQIIETSFKALRIAELLAFPIQRAYDLAHLRAIQQHIFQDMPALSVPPRDVDDPQTTGELRTQLTLFLLTLDEGMRTLPPDEFATRLAEYYALLDHDPMFSIGGAYTSAVFISSVAREAGYQISWPYIAARRSAFQKARIATRAAADQQSAAAASIALAAFLKGAVSAVAISPTTRWLPGMVSSSRTAENVSHDNAAHHQSNALRHLEDIHLAELEIAGAEIEAVDHPTSFTAAG